MNTQTASIFEQHPHGSSVYTVTGVGAKGTHSQPFEWKNSTAKAKPSNWLHKISEILSLGDERHV